MPLYFNDQTAPGLQFVDPNALFSTNLLPVITGVAAHNSPENSAFSYEYTITNMDGQLPTISGPDVLLFNWSAQGGNVYRLSLAAQDFENPVDANTDNVYSVTITADDTVNIPVTLDVTVTISNLLEVVITPPADTTLEFANGGTGLAHNDAALLAWLATESATGGGIVTNNLASKPNPLPAGIHVFSFDTGDASQQTATLTVSEAAAASDTTPDFFDLGDPVTNAIFSSVHYANGFVVSGADSGIDLSIAVTGGEYRIDSGAWTSLAGTIQNGQTVEFRVTASSQPFTTVEGVLDINGVSSSFYVVTGENAGGQFGVAFFVRDASTNALIVNTTIDLKVVTAQFGGTVLAEFDDLAIDASGYLAIPLTGGFVGQQVFISGVLANGKYITGNTAIMDISGV